MDRRVKYSLKEKLSIVRSIVSGRESINSAAKELGCGRTTVQDWFLLYQEYGVAGLRLRVKKYSGTFKVKVVQHMLQNKLSLMRTGVIFGIPHSATIHRWRLTYERLGEQGLLEMTIGRKKSLMPKKKTTKKTAPQGDHSAERLAALQKEVEYLRAENAFLKKLDALIQQEEAAKAKSK